MGLVGTTVELDQSVTQSNPKKYQAYVTGCNGKKFNDGTWSPTSATGIGVSVSNNILSVWNNNSSTSDVSQEFSWHSSRRASCWRRFTVKAKGKEAVKDYCPTATIELYDSGNNIISGGEGAGNPLYINITVTDWKDVPESNRNTFGSYNNGGNNITISYPSCYVGGYSSWSGNSYSILGGLSGTNCADGEYSFSITICGQTYTKKYTKKTTTASCPTASFSTTSTTCNIFKTKTVYVNVSDWGSVTSGNYDTWGSTSGNNLKITVDKNQNYSYSIGNYNSSFKRFPINITHTNNNCDNSLDDCLKLNLKCVSSNVTLSSVNISPNYGEFVTTFNKTLSGDNWLEIYIKAHGCTQTISSMNGSGSPTTQYLSIWRSVLDIPCGSSNCDNSCTSVSFTIGWTISGTVNIKSIKANGTTLSGSESNTFSLNPCTTRNFNVSVEF